MELGVPIRREFLTASSAVILGSLRRPESVHLSLLELNWRRLEEAKIYWGIDKVYLDSFFKTKRSGFVSSRAVWNVVEGVGLCSDQFQKSQQQRPK